MLQEFQFIRLPVASTIHQIAFPLVNLYTRQKKKEEIKYFRKQPVKKVFYHNSVRIEQHA